MASRYDFIVIEEDWYVSGTILILQQEWFYVRQTTMDDNKEEFRHYVHLKEQGKNLCPIPVYIS